MLFFSVDQGSLLASHLAVGCPVSRPDRGVRVLLRGRSLDCYTASADPVLCESSCCSGSCPAATPASCRLPCQTCCWGSGSTSCSSPASCSPECCPCKSFSGPCSVYGISSSFPCPCKTPGSSTCTCQTSSCGPCPCQSCCPSGSSVTPREGSRTSDRRSAQAGTDPHRRADQ